TVWRMLYYQLAASAPQPDLVHLAYRSKSLEELRKRRTGPDLFCLPVEAIPFERSYICNSLFFLTESFGQFSKKQSFAQYTLSKQVLSEIVEKMNLIHKCRDGYRTAKNRLLTSVGFSKQLIE